jgi:hypothetical protein
VGHGRGPARRAVLRHRRRRPRAREGGSCSTSTTARWRAAPPTSR